MPLARRLASRYRGPEPAEDLEQVASLGLVKAVETFDPARGTSFASYAVPTILGELRRHFRDHSWSLHVPREVQERVLLVERTAGEMPAELGRAPTVKEIAARLGLEAEQVLEAMEASSAHRVVSLASPQANSEGEEGAELMERLGGTDPGFEAVEYDAAIEAVLETLSPRDRFVFRLRFDADLTQTEIANRVGVSQMHVSRILRATLEKLRAAVPEPE